MGATPFFGLFVMQGVSSDCQGSSLTLRIIGLTMLVFGYFFANSFSAGLSSALSVRVRDDSVNNLYDVDVHDYDMYVQGGSLDSLFITARQGSVEARLWEKVLLRSETFNYFVCRFFS